MTTQIVMGGYGPSTTTHSRALKIIGERLIKQFGGDVDVKYVWNIMDFGYKGEEVLWMSERGLLTLAYQSTSYLTERVPELEFADLPFLFAGLDEARAAMKEEGADKVKRHIFLCAESEKGKCCPRAIGSASWKFLKRRLKELELDRDGGIYRPPERDHRRRGVWSVVGAVWRCGGHHEPREPFHYRGRVAVQRP